MSEQATEPDVVEGRHLQKVLKTRRTTTVSPGDVIEAGLFIGRWQVRSHRQRVMGDSIPKQRAPYSPVMSDLLGDWQS
jgi:hypothetical protein